MIRDHGHGGRFSVSFCWTAIVSACARVRLDKAQARDLVLMAAQLVLANLGDQVPHDHVGVASAAGQAHTGLVKG